MFSRTSQKADPIHIDESHNRIVMHPDNNDLFVVTGKQAILSCQLNINIKLWLEELDSALEYVRKWCNEHSDQVANCFAAPNGNHVTFFIIPQSSSYNFELGRDMADLNLYLVHDYNIGMVELLQIPADDINRFVNTNQARHLFGEYESSH